ncbi:unnamed protein product [Effrenium voratum]|nr:unnamed protein product [Effrenium voratum]
MKARRTPQIIVQGQDDDAESEEEDVGDSGKYAAQGEEYEEVDEEKADRDQQILQEACLPVSGAPLPPSEAPPKDADEYLRQVQWERLHCPQVMDVEVKERKSRKKVGGPLTGRDGQGGLLALFQAPEVPENFYNEVWAQDAAAAFRVLRSHCHSRADAKSLSYEEWRRHVSRDRPDFELLSLQDFVGINHLVVVAVDQLEDFESAKSEASLDAEGLDSTIEWAFASLAFVETPLVDDIQYQLQRLRRVCCRLASLIKAEGAESPGLRPRIALILVIVGEVFGQQ